METFLEFFSLSDPNVRFVVLGMVLLGACSGVVGCFTFLRKRALLGDAIAHSILPGVCLAFMLTGIKHPLMLLAGACLTGWLSLVFIDWITNNSRIKSDAAIGLTLSVFFGVGILLLTVIQHSGNAAQSGLDKFLLGKAASLIGSDVWIFGSLSLLLLLLTIAFFKEFSLISFDPDFAYATGLPVRFLEVVLASMTVLAVAIGIQGVGVVLMAALLITPATAARYWTDNLPLMVFLAAIFGALSGVGGAYVSYLQPNMPTGPWIVVVLTVIAIGSMLFAPKKGVVARYWLQRNNRLQMLEENILKLFFHLSEKQNPANPDFFQMRTVEELQQSRSFAITELKAGLNRLTKKESLKKVGNAWQLMPSGKQKAQRLIRIHRLWEVYLTQYLKIAPDHVHDDAEAIEHIITPELELELEKLLNYPKKDPHNSTIPY